jgi:rubrerythrin
MYESHRTLKDSDSDGDYVEFARADGKGEFNCAGCGYGITVNHKLPRCPMCGEGLWERSQWSPFRHGLTGLTSRLN